MAAKIEMSSNVVEGGVFCLFVWLWHFWLKFLHTQVKGEDFYMLIIIRKKFWESEPNCPVLGPRMHQSEGREAGETCALKTGRWKDCSALQGGQKHPGRNHAACKLMAASSRMKFPLKKKSFFSSSTFLQQDNLTLGVLFCFFPFFSSFLLKCDCCSKFCMSREKQHQSICLKALCSQPCMTPGLQHITILPHSKEGARHMLNSQHTP